MFEISVENSQGKRYTFNNPNEFVVYKIEGLNPPQATLNKSSNATTDGCKVTSAKVESRNLVIYTTIENDAEENRNKLYEYFQVAEKATIFYKSGLKDVYIEGIVETLEVGAFEEKETVQISIVCEKPFFKSVDYIVTTFSSVVSLFEFPFSIPESGVEFSAITTNIRKKIVNTGDVKTGAIIRMYATGTVKNPILYDVLKKTHMKLKITMKPSDEIVINTNQREKSITLVRNGEITNILGVMQKDSEFFTLEPGDNIFAYTCESGDANLIITFTTIPQYGGV